MSIRKRLLSIIATVAMLTAMLPVNAYAIDIDKTADSTLDGNNQTTVTLNVGGTQDGENVAVLFVLDYSTSVDVRKAAASFVDELAEKENTNVKACVINYWADADTGTWTTINSTTNASDLLAQPTNKSGTNYHAGLLAAQKALNSDEIAGYTTYLVTISDGITYLWTDKDTETTMSVYTELGNTTSNTNEVNDYRVITDDMFTALVTPTDAVKTAVSNTETIAEEWSTSTKGYRSATEGDYVSADEFDTQTKLSGSEMAIYKTVSVYEELVSQVDNAYAFKLDEGHWTAYPYGEQLMNYLAGSSAKPSGQITDTSASETFANVSDQILYEIMSGTVTDVIGEDFDWVGMDTVKLTVGTTDLKGTVDGNTVTFGTADGNGVYPYVVTYTDKGTSESFTWNINVPVEAANGLTLSYDLVLSKDYVVPESGKDVLPTNESAVIDYKDPDGDDKKEEFPVPEVVIGGEKISEPGIDKTIVLTDDTEVEQDDVAAGDTVNYKLTSNVPSNLSNYIDYTATEDSTNTNVIPLGTVGTDEDGNTCTYTLTFHDMMDNALTYNNNLKVCIDNTLLESTYYTVTTSDLEDGCTFEVSMDLLALYTAKIITEDDFGTAEIIVTFSALLSEDAVAGSYYNTAWVVYPDGKSEEDKVEVDTYAIKILKYDQEKASNNNASPADAPLANAIFTLYSDSDLENTVVGSLVSEDNGYITVNGLDAGTYYLVENEAPTGYVASGKKIEITVDSDAAGADHIILVEVANAPIPSTGGAGTRMYLIGGACLIAAAGTVFIVSRRKKED